MAVNNVAVAVNSKESSRGAVKWTLTNLVSSSDVLTLIHVRPPVTHIPSPMGHMPVSQVVPEVVAAYVREIELKTVQLLRTFTRICEAFKVSAETVVLEADSVQKSLVQEIIKRGITKLVLGAPSRNLFTKKFLGPGLPDFVSKNAPDFCSVYIISKQRVDSVKESRQRLERDNSASSSLSSTHESESLLQSERPSIPSIGEIEAIELNPGVPVQSAMGYQSQPLPLNSRSGNHDIPIGAVQLRSLSVPHAQQNSNSPLLTSNYRPGEHNPSTTPNLHQHRHIEPQPYHNFSDKLEGPHDLVRRTHSAESHPPVPAYPDSWSVTSNTVDQDLLATSTYDNTDTEALCKNNAGQDGILAAVKAKEIAARQLQEATSHLETLKAQIRAAQKDQRLQKALAEVHFARQVAKEESRRRIEAEAKLIQDEEARVELTRALRKAQQQYRIYSFNEILAATNNLSEDHKLGEGGYGVVYKGKLHHTNVAIKVLKEDTSQGLEEFQHEVEVLGRIHHPHMVLLLGCCPEKACLVYEFMANGSLEDRLKSHGGTRPLPWYTRFKIAAEVATALFFLHSSKPEPIIHRDLKPGNILLDQNFVSKLGDVGLASLIPESLAAKNSTCFRDTLPVGTFAYIDPEYQHTGFFGPKSDVYALGIVVLQLLTGRPPVGIIQFVKDSFESGFFPDILDQSAGDWPLEEATQVAHLALKCSSLKRKSRPDLASILPIFEMICDFADWAAKGMIEEPDSQENVPELYICPILKGVMEEPVIAADGYTYEQAAIQQWLQEHDTSPLTNLPLAHSILTPNFSLRYVIREWMQGGRRTESYSL